MPTLKLLIKNLVVAGMISAAVIMPISVFAQTQQETAAGAPSASAPASAPVGAPSGNTSVTATQPIAANAGKPTECGWADVACGLMKAFQNVSIWIGYLIGYVAAFFISMASSLIQVIIDMSAKIVSSPLVTEGFKVSLSIANLGFVLAIIVIALTTMLRISGYETKKMLRNLVLAAVLVNFSFLIAGTILDFGNVFGNFFLTAVSPQSGNFSHFADNLANSLNVQKLSGISPKDAQGLAGALTSFGAAYVSLFASTAAVAIFSIFLVIVFFAIAFMLLARYVYITILLILMPMAWLTWIFPGFSHLFSKWWSKFIQWTIFYPAVTFFLYLGILTSQKLGELVQTGLPQQLAQTTGDLANIGTNTVVALIQVLVQVGILLGGLMAANALGIEGASTALGYASKVKGWAIGATGRASGAYALGRGAKNVGGAVAGTAAANLMQKGGAAEKVGGFLMNTKVIRSLPFARSAGIALSNAAAARQDAVASIQKDKYGSYSKDALLAEFNSYTASKEDRAAQVNQIVKKGLAEKVDPARLDAYLKDAKDMGATKDIVATRPDFAPKVTSFEEISKADSSATKENWQQKAVESAMSSFKPGKIDELPAKAIKEVSKYFSKAMNERLAKEGDAGQILAYIKAANELARENPQHPTVKFALENPAMQVLVDDPRYAGDLADLKNVPIKKAAAKKLEEEAEKVIQKAEENIKREEELRKTGGY